MLFYSNKSWKLRPPTATNFLAAMDWLGSNVGCRAQYASYRLWSDASAEKRLCACVSTVMGEFRNAGNSNMYLMYGVANDNSRAAVAGMLCKIDVSQTTKCLSSYIGNFGKMVQWSLAPTEGIDRQLYDCHTWNKPSWILWKKHPTQIEDVRLVHVNHR